MLTWYRGLGEQLLWLDRSSSLEHGHGRIEALGKRSEAARYFNDEPQLIDVDTSKAGGSENTVSTTRAITIARERSKLIDLRIVMVWRFLF